MYVCLCSWHAWMALAGSLLLISPVPGLRARRRSSDLFPCRRWEMTWTEKTDNRQTHRHRQKNRDTCLMCLSLTHARTHAHRTTANKHTHKHRCSHRRANANHIRMHGQRQSRRDRLIYTRISTLTQQALDRQWGTAGGQVQHQHKSAQMLLNSIEIKKIMRFLFCKTMQQITAVKGHRYRLLLFWQYVCTCL